MNDAARGKQLVDAGILAPKGMIDCLDLGAYFDTQRERVRRCGQCETGCDRTALVKHPATGITVCPRTFEPCKTRRLGRIIGMFERLFSSSQKVGD